MQEIIHIQTHKRRVKLRLITWICRIIKQHTYSSIIGGNHQDRPNEKCKLLFIGKKRAKITLEDIYYLSNLLRCLIGSVFTWDIIGDKLFSNDQDDLDGYLIIGEE